MSRKEKKYIVLSVEESFSNSIPIQSNDTVANWIFGVKYGGEFFNNLRKYKVFYLGLFQSLPMWFLNIALIFSPPLRKHFSIKTMNAFLAYNSFMQILLVAIIFLLTNRKSSQLLFTRRFEPYYVFYITFVVGFFLAYPIGGFGSFPGFFIFASNISMFGTFASCDVQHPKVRMEKPVTIILIITTLTVMCSCYFGSDGMMNVVNTKPVMTWNLAGGKVVHLDAIPIASSHVGSMTIWGLSWLYHLKFRPGCKMFWKAPLQMNRLTEHQYSEKILEIRKKENAIVSNMMKEQENRQDNHAERYFRVVSIEHRFLSGFRVDPNDTLAKHLLGTKFAACFFNIVKKKMVNIFLNLSTLTLATVSVLHMFAPAFRDKTDGVFKFALPAFSWVLGITFVIRFLLLNKSLFFLCLHDFQVLFVSYLIITGFASLSWFLWGDTACPCLACGLVALVDIAFIDAHHPSSRSLKKLDTVKNFFIVLIWVIGLWFFASNLEGPLHNDVIFSFTLPGNLPPVETNVMTYALLKLVMLLIFTFRCLWAATFRKEQLVFLTAKLYSNKLNTKELKIHETMRMEAFPSKIQDVPGIDSESVLGQKPMPSYKASKVVPMCSTNEN